MGRLIVSTFASLDGIMQALGGPNAIIALKTEPGPDLQINGSGNLIQTLQAATLITEYNMGTFPVVLGRGKRLFGETAKRLALRLLRFGSVAVDY